MAFAIDTYTGNGSTTSYSVTFPYISTTDVVVTVDGVTKTLTTDYTFSNSSTIAFVSAPANSSIIKITRSSNRNARLVDYQDGSTLTEASLDQDGNQTFFMAQEAIDITEGTLNISTATDQWDAINKRLTNVADPVNNNDAVNKQFISTNLPNITTVAGIASDVTTVANNNANITAVAADATDIGTVATNISSVNTVATNINDVIAVANDLAEAVSEVETVANDLNEATSEIDTVATSIANVDTVGTNIANVNTVAGIDANVTTVAGISADVTGVAGISTAVTNVNSNSTNINAVNANSANINTVAGIDSDVTSVAGISSAVSAVNSNSSNINAVNTNSANINTVASNNTDISTVASNDTNITTVAGISANVTSVAGNSANINAVASNETNINTVNANSTNISTVATNIANVNNVGGSIANVNAVASNISDVNNFADTYFISGTAPSSPTNGDLWYDSSLSQLKYWTGSSWVGIGVNTDETTKVSANDTTNGYLNGKLVAGNGITLTENNDGANETLTITSTSIETKPTVTSISPSAIFPSTQTQITITGTNFVSGANVEAVATNGAVIQADTVSFTNSTTLVVNFTITTNGNYFLRIENPDGNAVRSSTTLLLVSPAPTWTTSSGSIGTIVAGDPVSLSVAGTSDSTVVYSETTAVLTSNANTPSATMNLSLNSATGAITGTAPSATTATTYNFTLRITDQENQTADRAFSISVLTGIENSGGFN